MKKYLCILILALCASLLPVSPALADTVSWVRITQDNTRFYRNPTNMDADIMFELEKSYYLKVVSEQSYFYQVELMDNDNGFVKIYGYVKKTDVTPCDTVPELPLYPAVYISVTGSNAILYSACSTASQPLCSVFYGQQLNYYGSMTVANSKWYFVKTGETFAYINSAYASAPLINPHPTPLPGEETPEPEPVQPNTDSEQTEQPSQSFDMQIALIILICIPAVIIVVILFIPTRPKPKSAVSEPYRNETAAANLPAPAPKEKKARPRYFDDYL